MSKHIHCPSSSRRLSILTSFALWWRCQRRWWSRLVLASGSFASATIGPLAATAMIWTSDVGQLAQCDSMDLMETKERKEELSLSHIYILCWNLIWNLIPPCCEARDVQIWSHENIVSQWLHHIWWSIYGVIFYVEPIFIFYTGNLY